VVGEHGRGGQLVADPVGVGTGAQLTDPDAAIAGADEHGAVAAAHDGAGDGPLAGVDPAAVRIEPRDRHATQPRMHPRGAVGGTDAAQHPLGGVGPGEATIGPADRRSEPSADTGAGVVQPLGRKTGVGEPGYHLVDQCHCGVGHRSVVEGALAGRVGVDGKGARGPDRAGVHLLDCLQRGDPPDRFCIHDRPVQRGWSAVAPGTGMDHDRGIRAPHVLGHPVAQKRADQHVGLDGRERRPERVVVTRRLHGDLVPGRSQLDPRPLGQAVERRTEQHDPQ
jgi:hypothetical protein